MDIRTMMMKNIMFKMMMVMMMIIIIVVIIVTIIIIIIVVVVVVIIIHFGNRALFLRNNVYLTQEVFVAMVMWPVACGMFSPNIWSWCHFV